MSADTPIIVKKKKAGHGHGHHGGAWKVAYADFVTAMMAFFLLMWLLNATTENQRKGLADYFDPRIPISRVSGGGTDMFGGSSVFTKDRLAQNGTGGIATRQTTSKKSPTNRDDDPPPEAQFEAAHRIDLRRQPGEIRDSEVQGDARPFDADGEATDASFRRTEAEDTDTGATNAEAPGRPADPAASPAGTGETAANGEAETLAEAIAQKAQERADYQGLDRHLIFKVTEEGLRIEVVDRDGAPMFESGVANATPRMRALVQVIAEVLAETPHKVALTGHTDAIQYANSSRYGNWELSTDRAQAARRLLENFGTVPDRIQRVEGLADTVPLIADDPDDPRNRRIGIVVLRGDR